MYSTKMCAMKDAQIGDDDVIENSATCAISESRKVICAL
jgi:hypothetical protein